MRVEGSYCLRGVLEVSCSFPGLFMDFIAIPVNIVLQSASEPSRVFNLLDEVLLFTLYLNRRRAPWGTTRDLIWLIAFKEADMENWMDLVILGQVQAV